MLIRSPFFAVVVVLILALAIGITTAMFSVVNAIILRPLPYDDPHRIVMLREQVKEGERFSYHQNFLYCREHNQVFESLAGYRGASYYVKGISRPHEVRAIEVTANLFSLLGTQPNLGRGFLPEEERPGNDRVLVLSHAFWREHLGKAPDIVGKTIRLGGDSHDVNGAEVLQDDESYTVVGVMPSEFEFPFARRTAFWVPMVLERGPVFPLARLKKGVTLGQARAAMAIIAKRLQQIDPKANEGRTISVERLLNRILKENRKLLLLLLGAAGFVLLIASSNVANLFLVRATVRQSEIAVRVALGASRWRILRQMLTEGLLLSVGAGMIGLLLTLVFLDGLVAVCPADIPRLHETRIDQAVLAFTLTISIFTGVLFSIIPAWKASDVSVERSLREGGRSGTGLTWIRLRGGLVVSQIALSLVMLVGAGLLIRSFVALHGTDLGFKPDNTLVVEIDLPRSVFPESHHCTAFFRSLVGRIRNLPQVDAVGSMALGLDLSNGSMPMTISVPGSISEGSAPEHSVRQAFVSPGYFEALGVKLLRGRTFIEADPFSHVVIDAELARRAFGDDDPIGQSISDQGMNLTIVGVVSTTRDFETPGVDGSVYMFGGGGSQMAAIVVRTDGDPMRVAGLIQAEVAAQTKDLVVTRLESMEAVLSRMLAPRRFSMTMLSLFAGIALILAVIGIFGLLQYSTTQQTRDFGIRMALGARRIDVLWGVLGEGLKLTLIGAVAGVAGTLALARIISSLLYDVSAADPLTLACVSVVLATTSLIASYIPAHRASKIDPMAALRYE